MSVGLYSADDWKICLRKALEDQSAKVIFVVGAGLSWDGKVGVWGVSEIISHVKTRIRCEALSDAGAAAYQAAMGKLKAQERPAGVDRVIRHAVLAAAKDGDAKARAQKEVESSTDLRAYRALQNDPSAWNLPAGVVALADLIGLMESRAKSTPGWQHPCVLSTNFDGLLEIALRQKGINCKSEVVAGDRFPHSLAEQVSVVHLHGYWLESPTLHDPETLKAPRPDLESALRTYLHGAQVFVMGYAGWDDIIFATTAKILDRQQSDRLPEVMWAFHESEKKVRDDEENRKSACGHVITSFSNSIASAQTTFYCGVDVHGHLPEVVQALAVPGAPVDSRPFTDSASLALVPHIEALVLAVPKAFQRDFEALLDDARQSKSVGLVGVVGMCCMVLETMARDPEARAKFTDPAWDLITFMVREVVNPLKHRVDGHRAGTGQILRVPAKAHFLVALLLAKNPDPRRMLLPSWRGAVSPDDLSHAARWAPFETGPAEPDRMFQFEALVWQALSPNEPKYALTCNEASCSTAICARECNRRNLYARLGADAAKGRPHFLMINPGSEAAWRDIAAKAKEVVFVEPGGGATAGLDEDQLAFLISDFLKLTSKETL